MRSLEDRYRRLLRWYPADHRDKYEDEMVGVLLDGARPGQTRPGYAESWNLRTSGVRARVGGQTTALADPRWRTAAGVTGLVMSALLALKFLRPIAFTLFYEIRVPESATYFDAYTVISALGWIATTVVTAVGLRRTAIALAWVSVAASAIFLRHAATVEAYDVVYYVWTVAMGLTAAIAVTVGTPAGRGPARRAFGVAGALLLGWFVAYPLFEKTVTIDGVRTLEPSLWSPLRGYSWLGLNDAVATAFVGAAIVAALVGVARLEPPIRRRFLVLVAPALVIFLGITWYPSAFLPQGIYVYADPPAATGFSTAPSRLDLWNWLALIGLPAIVLLLGMVLVHRRDRTVELVDLGRRARRTG